jgi:hypothetical protein
MRAALSFPNAAPIRYASAVTTNMTSVGWVRRAAAVAALALLSGCQEKPGAPGKATAAPPKAEAETTEAQTVPAKATVSPRPADAPRPADSTVSPRPADSSDGPPKTFDCGSREKPCPMQGWMKRVMAPASSSRDPDALSKALAYVAAHVPPGFSTWAAIANDGGAKAAAGNIDDAKASCKQCHDTYKARYKATMRDRPF